MNEKGLGSEAILSNDLFSNEMEKMSLLEGMYEHSAHLLPSCQTQHHQLAAQDIPVIKVRLVNTYAICRHIYIECIYSKNEIPNEYKETNPFKSSHSF